LSSGSSYGPPSVRSVHLGVYTSSSSFSGSENHGSTSLPGSLVSTSGKSASHSPFKGLHGTSGASGTSYFIKCLSLLIMFQSYENRSYDSLAKLFK